MQINELDSDKEYSVRKDPTNQAANFFIDEASEETNQIIQSQRTAQTF